LLHRLITSSQLELFIQTKDSPKSETKNQNIKENQRKKEPNLNIPENERFINITIPFVIPTNTTLIRRKINSSKDENHILQKPLIAF